MVPARGHPDGALADLEDGALADLVPEKDGALADLGPAIDYDDGQLQKQNLRQNRRDDRMSTFPVCDEAAKVNDRYHKFDHDGIPEPTTEYGVAGVPMAQLG